MTKDIKIYDSSSPILNLDFGVTHTLPRDTILTMIDCLNRLNSQQKTAVTA